MCHHATHRHSIFCILPPHMLRHIAENGTCSAGHGRPDPDRRPDFANLRPSYEPAASTEPAINAVIGRGREAPHHLYARRQQTLPGGVVRVEGGPPTGDAAVDEAYDGLGATFDLYWEVYQRNSIDDQGLPLDATVHFGRTTITRSGTASAWSLAMATANCSTASPSRST